MNFIEKLWQMNDDTIAYDSDAITVDDARGQEVKIILDITDNNSVTSIISALEKQGGQSSVGETERHCDGR